MLPFIILCRNSAKRWTQISDYLFKFTVPNKTINAYIYIGDEINTLTDTNRCPYGKITTPKEALKRYKSRLHRQMQYKTRSEKNLTNNKMKCPECRTQFFDLFKFNKHIRNLKRKMCGECNEIVDVTHYEKHVKSHKLCVFSCPICLESFERESAYISHQSKHQKGTVVCIECHMPFANTSYLNSHMHKHKPVVCGCGKRLPNRTCFFNHKKTCIKHKNIKTQYICDYCKKEYSRKNVLRMHIKHRHTVGSLFQCDRCGKKFNSRMHLIEHGNTHEKIRDRFVCECGANFSSRRGYQRHYKTQHEDSVTPCVRIRNIPTTALILGIKIP